MILIKKTISTQTIYRGWSREYSWGRTVETRQILFSFRDIYREYYEKQVAQLAERQMYFCRLWVRVPLCFFYLYQTNIKDVHSNERTILAPKRIYYINLLRRCWSNHYNCFSGQRYTESYVFDMYWSAWINFRHEKVEMEDGMECYIINVTEPMADFGDY